MMLRRAGPPPPPADHGTGGDVAVRDRSRVRQRHVCRWTDPAPRRPTEAPAGARCCPVMKGCTTLRPVTAHVLLTAGRPTRRRPVGLLGAGVHDRPAALGRDRAARLLVDAAVLIAVGVAAARAVRRDRDLLCSGTEQPKAFQPSMVADLPESARRWLTHAIPLGTTLWQSVERSMRGQIRIGAWRPFTARQVLTPPRGFIWAATARVFGIPVIGFDRLSSGSGQMRWRLGGLVPVMSATGPDITRSAAGRLAGEMALVPTTFPAAAWAAGSDDDRVVVTAVPLEQAGRGSWHAASHSQTSTRPSRGGTTSRTWPASWRSGDT
jgi:hypothetical protein